LKNSNTRRLLAALRFWGGYALFGGVVIYGIYHAPEEIWKLKLQWLLLAVLVFLAMMVLQTLQVCIFLKVHDMKCGWFWPALFTVKKGVLNSVLPARTGTLALMYMLTQRYQVKWHEYLRFSIVASCASLLVSGLAFAWIVLSQVNFLMMFVGSILGCYVLSHVFSRTYMGRFVALFGVGLGLYTTMLISFWCLLNGLGMPLDFRATSYFATAVNTLAQLAVTPGNIGIRELVTGMVAPYVSLDIAVGIIVGGIFHVVRTTVYAVAMVALEKLAKSRSELSYAALSDIDQRKTR